MKNFFLILVILMSCQKKEKLKIKNNNNENINQENIIKKGRISSGTNNNSDLSCRQLGFSPDDVNIESSISYWKCRKNLSLNNENLTEAEKEIQKLKQTDISKSGIAKSAIEEDKEICKKYGFDQLTGGFSRLKHYRCLTMLLLTNGKFSKKQIEEVDDLSDISHVFVKPSNKEVENCQKYNSPQIYSKCIEKIENKNKCMLNLEIKLSIDYYNGIIDCRNIVALKLPSELTKKRTRKVKFADEDGKLNEGTVIVKPAYTDQELEIERNKMYSSCIKQKRDDRIFDRQYGIKVCINYEK